MSDRNHMLRVRCDTRDFAGGIVRREIGVVVAPDTHLAGAQAAAQTKLRERFGVADPICDFAILNCWSTALRVGA